jgi:hypothetical protein
MSLKKDGKISIFYYPGSKWANPYKVDEYGLEECLELYREHIHRTGLVTHISELTGRNLGCFCSENSPCHAKILAELANNTEK